MFRDSPFLSRLIAVALLVCVVAAIGVVIVEPLAAKRAKQAEEISRNEELIKRFSERRTDLAALRARLKALQKAPETKTAYLSARNATLGAAQLQSRIKALTKASGASLVSTQVLSNDGDKDAKFLRVTVRANMTAKVAALRQIFYALEAGRPYLFIDNVSITNARSRRLRRVRSRGRQPARPTGVLTVRYDVYSYIWRGAAP